MGSSGERPWKKRVFVALYIFAIANVLVSTERIIFDALGQMWVTLFINGVTVLASLICILGVVCKKNTAILAFIVCSVIALGVNIVIILIFNDVGTFSDKERYLALNLNEKHWWRNHGFLCYRVCDHEAGDTESTAIDDDTGSTMLSLLDGTRLSDREESSGAGERIELQNCFASYAVIETAHATINSVLMVVTIILSIFTLNLKKMKRRNNQHATDDDDDDSFRYVGVGRYGGNARTAPRQPSFYKLSDSFDTSLSN